MEKSLNLSFSKSFSINTGIIRKAAEQIFDGIQRAGDGKMFLIK